jgi:hypothetical protein
VTGSQAASMRIGSIRVELTNTVKVFFPGDEITSQASSSATTAR